MGSIYIIIAAVVLIVIVGAILGWFLVRRKQADNLKDYSVVNNHSGKDEHDQLVNALDNENTAYTAKDGSQKHVEGLKIQELSPEDREQFQSEWSDLRSNFVYEPDVVIVGADHLVQNIMRKRAYPVSDFDQRASDLSVSYPALVSNYQAAREATLKHGRGEVNPDELSGVMEVFESLFDELLGTNEED